MDPFNIVIRRDGKQLALNIHPKEETGYMVLFEGSLVGEVFLDENGKISGTLTARQLLEGDYPNYPCDESADCEGLMQDQVIVSQIGKEIYNALGLTPSS